jgi:DNA mismatch endonuclease (patch repair protein)
VVDTISRERRSENMRRIRSKGTKPEMVVRRLVHAMGCRFRLHSSKLPGKPDLVLPRLNSIIEVRGCFWHQHRGCLDAHIPKSHIPYWRPKLQRNAWRDKQVVRQLRKLGWRVLVIWECEANRSKPDRLSERLKKFLKLSD